MTRYLSNLALTLAAGSCSVRELTAERVVHSLQVERQPVAVHEREPIAA